LVKRYFNYVISSVNCSEKIVLQIFNIVGGDIDYKSGPYEVRIPTGQTSVQFTVNIIDDNILEGNEIFILTIDPSSIPSDIAAGNPNQTTVTIVDNDG